MQFEDFDNKIRDAADHHHPAYNEKAWARMKNMLDTHLPEEKKDRRRFILFLLLFILLGGGAFLLVSKPWQQTSAVTQTNTPTTSNKPTRDDRTAGAEVINKNRNAAPATTDPGTPAGGNNDNRPAEHPAPLSNPLNEHPAETGKINSVNNNQQQFDITINPAGKSKSVKKSKNAVVPKPGNDVESRFLDKKENSPVIVSAEPLVNKPSVQKTTEPNTTNQPDPVVINKDEPQKLTEPTNLTTSPAVKAESPVKTGTDTASKPEPESQSKKKQPKRASDNGLAVNISAGPDVSAIGLSDIGRLKPVYGFGLSYTFADRFTVRTGFYTAHKVYSAEPSEYKFATPPPNASYLYQINADCKVYEIPLNLAYRFGKSGKQNGFAALGLSSYIMKEENYDYVYKYPNNTYIYPWDYKNENNHFFSVVSLSGGYTRKINRTFSLSAEPYLKLPLSGIGVGKLKLNSGGVLFTLSARLTGNKK